MYRTVETITGNEDGPFANALLMALNPRVRH